MDLINTVDWYVDNTHTSISIYISTIYKQQMLLCCSAAALASNFITTSTSILKRVFYIIIVVVVVAAIDGIKIQKNQISNIHERKYILC